jgi:uncharacterized protein (TIGR00369 family)
MPTLEFFNQFGSQNLPGHLGIVITRVDDGEVHAQMPVRQQVMAPNGFLHAGAIVTLADTAAGYGCVQNLPAGASGFTTVELKSNHMGTLRDGMVACVAKPMHLGRTTQVWDVVVTAEASGKTLALFRCTQMLLYPK